MRSKIVQRKLLVLLVFYATALFGKEQHFKYIHAQITSPNGEVVQVEVADTEAKRTQGLGFREALPVGKGMLFVFDKKARYGFWMKNMKIAIDIIWLNNHQVVDVLHNVQPPETPQTTLKPFYPKTDANFVLELSAGEARRLGFQTGSVVGYQF